MEKTLVIYFSVYGTARKLAMEVARQLNAKLVEIVPEEPYDANRNHYRFLLRRAQKEQAEDQRPVIKNQLPIAEYDRIYLGYPIWCYNLPMIIRTLFEQYDFSGKTIMPFNTNMGSRDGGTYVTLQRLASQAQVLPGLPVEMNEAENNTSEIIEQWLESNHS